MNVNLHPIKKLGKSVGSYQKYLEENDMTYQELQQEIYRTDLNNSTNYSQNYLGENTELGTINNTLLSFAIHAGDLENKLDMRTNEFKNLVEKTENTLEESMKFVNKDKKNKKDIGWDFNISSPKSVSILANLSSPEDRAFISNCEEKAMMKALEELLKYTKSSYTETQPDGKKIKVEKLATPELIQIYKQYDSREKDPNNHFHIFISNVSTEGKSMHFKNFNQQGHDDELLNYNQHTLKHLSYLYNTELAKNLSQKYDVELTHNLKTKDYYSDIEIKGISTEIKNTFSNMTTKAEKLAAEENISTGEALKKIRAKKDGEISIGELRDSWNDTALKNNFNVNNVSKNNKLSIQEIETDNSIFFNDKLEKYKSITNGIHPSELDEYINNIKSNTDNYTPYPTTFKKIIKQNGIEVEKEYFYIKHIKNEAIDTVNNLLNTAFDISNKRLEKNYKGGEEEYLKKNGYNPNKKQKDFIMDYIESKSRIIMCEGLPGTGKSYSMAAIAGFVSSQHNKKIFVATTSNALQEDLEKDVGAKVDKSKFNGSNIAKLLASESLQKTIDKNTVLMIDEAGMLGNETMLKLLELTNKTGCQLLLIGDPKQLPPVEAGNGWNLLQQNKELLNIQYSVLDKITRQKNDEMLEIANYISNHNVEDTFIKLQEYNKLNVCSKEDLLNNICKDYVNCNDSKLLIVNTNKEVDEANSKVQDLLLKSGKLNANKSLSLCNNKNNNVVNFNVYEGDTIRFTENKQGMTIGKDENKYYNNQSYTVKYIDKSNDKIILQKPDSENTIELKISEISKSCPFKIGYSNTCHSIQGKTVDKAFILATDSNMSTVNNLNVSITRAKHDSQIYLTEDTKENFTKIYNKKVNDVEFTSIQSINNTLNNLHKQRDVMNEKAKESIEVELKGSITNILVNSLTGKYNDEIKEFEEKNKRIEIEKNNTNYIQFKELEKLILPRLESIIEKQKDYIKSSASIVYGKMDNYVGFEYDVKGVKYNDSYFRTKNMEDMNNIEGFKKLFADTELKKDISKYNELKKSIESFEGNIHITGNKVSELVTKTNDNYKVFKDITETSSHFSDVKILIDVMEKNRKGEDTSKYADFENKILNTDFIDKLHEKHKELDPNNPHSYSVRISGFKNKVSNVINFDTVKDELSKLKSQLNISNTVQLNNTISLADQLKELIKPKPIIKKQQGRSL